MPTISKQNPPPHPQYTGQKLRAFAFRLLGKREYSKVELCKKLIQYAVSEQEAIQLAEELAEQHYQSDTRMAGMIVRQQLRQGRGIKRIQQNLTQHHIDQQLAVEELANIDWFAQALQTKIKKFGTQVATDPKQQAKQIRYLQYRGYEMDIIFKVIKYKEDEMDAKTSDSGW